jgi:hypothetical protein
VTHHIESAFVLGEVAQILARGVVRLHRRMPLDARSEAEKPENSDRNCLEVPTDTVLSVTHGG